MCDLLIDTEFKGGRNGQNRHKPGCSCPPVSPQAILDQFQEPFSSIYWLFVFNGCRDVECVHVDL